MQDRFETLCQRIEAGYASVPQPEGLEEIQAAVQLERQTANARSAKP